VYWDVLNFDGVVFCQGRSCLRMVLISGGSNYNCINDDGGKMKQKTLKLRLCKAPDCDVMYVPYSTLTRACSGKCALVLVEIKKEEVIRRDLRQRKKQLRTMGELLALAQIQFNKFIRLRDRNDPCIDCGNYATDDDLFTGSRWDAGHYLTRGGYPELRFEELNCHKQLSSCNGGSHRHARKNRTVRDGYRERLIEKIGIEKVEWLEAPHMPKNYSREDVMEIREEYRLKVKELEKQL